MNGAMWRKKIVRSKIAVLLVVVLLGMSLSGCSNFALLKAEAAGVSQTPEETKAAGETQPEGDAQPDVKSEADEASISLEYNTGGDTPTITTVIFHLDKGSVEVNALASSMYELSYETTYKLEDNVLSLGTVDDITATDISGVAEILGLPKTLTASAFHTVSDNAGATVLTILFGDPQKPEEATVCFEMALEASVLDQIRASIEDVEELLHMEYTSETENEDSSKTTADIRFFSNGKLTLSGCINSLYQWEYNSRWEFDDMLAMEDPDVIKLTAAEGTEGFLERLGLDKEYKIKVKSKIFLDEDQLRIAIEGVPGDEMELLFHILNEDIKPGEENPEDEAKLLEFDPEEEIKLPLMAEFALAEKDAQSLGFSLADIKIVALEGIAFKESSLKILLGEAKPLEIIFKPENATNKNLKWKSENPGIAAVDATGTVTGKAEGQTKITAVSEDGDFEAACTVEVVNLTLSPQGKPQASVSGEVLFTVASGDSSITFYGNGQCAVNATHYEYAEGTPWPFYAAYTTRYDFSGNQLIIAGASASVVDSIGLLPNLPMSMNHSVTMTGDGGASITISASGKGFGTYTLSAGQVTQLKEIAGLVEKPETIAVVSVTLSETALTLAPGQNAALTAAVSPENATNTKVIWSSSNESIATVVDGNVQAIAEGTATITATTEDGQKTAECTVTVTKQASEDPGNTGNPDITLTYDDGKGDLATKATAEFFLSKKTVKVSALASGMYQLTYESAYTIDNHQLIIATVPGVTATDITGVAALLGLPATMTGDVAHTVTGTGEALTLTAMFGDTMIGQFTLSVDTQTKLGLSPDAGDDNPGGSEEPSMIAVEAVSLNETAMTLEPGTEKTLTAAIAPKNATDQTVIWTSSDESVAKVTDGKVQAVAEGSAIITVTTQDGNKTATCTVTVAKSGGQGSGDDKPKDVTLTYDDGQGDLATKTSAIFNLSGSTLKVNALVSGMYELKYETTYNVTDHQLAIATAADVTATDITGLAALLGLPETISGDVVHSVSQNGDAVTLTLMFGDRMIGQFTLTEQDCKNLGLKSDEGGDDKPDQELTGDITLKYDAGAGDLATKSTAAFFLSDKTFKLNALASGMYELKYETTYSVSDNQLIIATAAGVTAADISGIAGILGLPPTMTGDVVHTVTTDGAQLKITVMFADTKIGEFTLNGEALGQLGITLDDGTNPMESGLMAGVAKFGAVLDAEKDDTEPALDAGGENSETECNKETSEVEAGADIQNASETVQETAGETMEETATETSAPDSDECMENETEMASQATQETTKESSAQNSDASIEDNIEGKTETIPEICNSDSTEVSDTEDIINVTGITLEKTELEMKVDDNLRLKTQITPTEATNQKVIWTSSDEKIVKIEKDELQAIGEGKVTITAKTEDGGKIAVCKITVKAKDVQVHTEQTKAPEDKTTDTESAPEVQSSDETAKAPAGNTQAEVKQPETGLPAEAKQPEAEQPAGEKREDNSAAAQDDPLKPDASGEDQPA